MSRTIEVHRVGDTRRAVRVLDPGTYDLCRDGKFVVIKVRCSIEVTEVFRGWAGWVNEGNHIDTLAALPTRWQRFKAWLVGREALPRAIVITEGK